MSSSTMMKGPSMPRASQALTANEPTTIATSHAHGGIRRAVLPTKLDLGETSGDLSRFRVLRGDPDVRRGLAHLS